MNEHLEAHSILKAAPMLAFSISILLLIAGCPSFSPLQNGPPKANAGSDQPNAKVGIKVTLDGTKSSDPDNNALTYEWTFQSIALDSSLANEDITNANLSLAYFTSDVAGTYILQLKVSDGEKDSTDTVIITATFLSLVTPTGLTVGGATQTSLTISWDAVSDATSYQLFRDTNQSGSFSTKVYDNSGTSYTDTGLISGTIYWYMVQASNPIGSSAKSEAISGTTMSVPPPAVTTGLSVSGATWSSLTISWNAVSGATSYQAFRNTSSLGQFTNQVYSGSGTGFTDSGLASNTTYYYVVQARNAYGAGPISGFLSGTTLVLGVPVNLEASQGVYQNKITVAWSPALGASKYHIYRSSSHLGEFSSLVITVNTSFDDISSTNASPWFYSVCAIDSQNQEGSLSETAEGWLSVDVTALIGGDWQLIGIGNLDWTQYNQYFRFSNGMIMSRYGMGGLFSGDGSYTIIGRQAIVIVVNTINEGLVDNTYTVFIPGNVMTWWDLTGIQRYAFQKQ